MKLHFHKYQALGNDFVLFDRTVASNLPRLTTTQISEICDRRFGVGADGILIFDNETEPEIIRMIYFNADGGRGETCFNGLRCLALHATNSGIASLDEWFTIISDAGEVQAKALETGLVTTRMTGPNFNPDEIPVSAGSDPSDIDVEAHGEIFHGSALSLGNPHFVIWREAHDLLRLNDLALRLGREIEQSGVFPNGVNVEFAEIVDESHIRMAVWERGSGVTLACGSGATATVCAGVSTGLLPKEAEVEVEMAGGTLMVVVEEDLSQVQVTGETALVFAGEIDL